MEKHILSKSTFIKGEQCLKYLYLYKKRYFLRDRMPAERIAVFTRGTRAGVIARELFPGGTDCGAKSPRGYAKAVEKTQNAINDGTKVIYEACFISHNTLIFLDILVKKDDGWHAFEVKSSLKLSETYFKDAALQNYVIRESGLNLKSFNLVHINENYVFSGKFDIHKAFTIVNVSKHARELYESTGRKIQQQLEVLQQPHSPKIKTGLHCRKPYECDFIGHCWKNIPQKSVFGIAALTFEKKMAIYDKTNGNLKESYDFLFDNPVAFKQLKAIEQNNIIYDYPEIRKLTSDRDTVFLKILKFAPALPVYNNTSPYQNIIYGFSLIIKKADGKTIHHETHISESAENPEQEIKDRITKIISPEYNIIIYEEDEMQYPVAATFNLFDLFSKGAVAAPQISDYRFSTVYQAVTGKSPWYKKIRIDKQAANIYEKLFRNNFKDVSDILQIKEYLSEQLKHIEKLYKTLSEI